MNGRGLYGNGFPALNQQQSRFTHPAYQVQSDRQADELMDESAFERAFDAANSHIQQMDDQRQKETVEAARIANRDAIKNPFHDFFEAVASLPPRPDRILKEALKDAQVSEAANDADELARTAGQLLDNLKHDQSQKFQQSNFLSLMRQLRDREVKVEGDKLVEVSTTPPV